MQLGALQNAHRYIVAVGTNVADLIRKGGVQSVLCAIPGKYRGSGAIKGKVAIGAADDQIDVLLLTVAIDKVHVIAAGSGFYKHIHTVIKAGVGCAIVAVHGAAKEVLGIFVG